jgi:hypothetical protein
MVCGDPSVQGAINAMRAGAVDFIVKPVGAAELNERVAQAMRRHAAGCRRRKRVRRLKRTCRKLNRMRNEVTQQVDILCKDLVTAYHDLAQQMQQMVQGAEYAALLRRELDLEQLLRKTLEFFLSKAGPTNAAIFLPANGGQFTLGGYVNYECASDSADTVLENLGDVLAPQILQYERPVHITDNDELAAWFAEDAPLLLDNHVVTFTCCHEDETLAVVVLFRHASAPYDESIFEMASGVAPMLGEYLAKVIRIHHRHIDGPDGDWDVGV